MQFAAYRSCAMIRDSVPSAVMIKRMALVVVGWSTFVWTFRACQKLELQRLTVELLVPSFLEVNKINVFCFVEEY